jgi:hypothetical protein
MIVEAIKYKPGWMLHLGDDNGRATLRWSFESIDYITEDKTVKVWHSRKWFLSEHMVESEIVQTALMAALAAEEHECREAFMYKGVHVFNPHISIEELMAVAQKREVRSTVG